MKKLFVLLFVLLAIGVAGLYFVKNKYRFKARPIATAPFITGDNFRRFCDHIYDETPQWFNPANVQKGDTVFVSGVYLDRFFDRAHPRIQRPYILVTHNCDRSVPRSHTAMGEYPQRDFSAYLDDPKIFAWFGQNVDLAHPKLIAIPIGLQNEHWGAQYPAKIAKINKHEKLDKKYLLYGNFNATVSNPEQRKPIYDYFIQQPYCYFSSKRKSLDDYLLDVAQSKFVLSPPGNGTDCHRTWEALYVGSYPIVCSSALDQLFAELPVMIVDDWTKINESLLAQKFAEFERNRAMGAYNMNKLTFGYWCDLIKAKQRECRLNADACPN